MTLYTLLGRLAVPCENIGTWLVWLRTHPTASRVGLDVIGKNILNTRFVGSVAPGTPGDPALFQSTLCVANGTELHLGYAPSWAEAESLHLVLYAEFRRPDRELTSS